MRFSVSITDEGKVHVTDNHKPLGDDIVFITEDTSYAYERADKLNQEWEDAQEVVYGITKNLNNMMNDGDMIAEAILQEHRTLQQKVFGMFLKTMKLWSELPEYRYDARNEYTVQKSKEIMKLLEGMTYTPHI